jgi:lipid-binding SYLF domain-containing protein
MQPMIRLFLASMLTLLPLAARAQTEQQTLVDRSTLAVQEMVGGDPSSDARGLLRQARGVMICPRVFKAGFFFGGQGGSCVMVGRLQTGWTGPAFYGLGSGSFGLQIGIQDAEILFIVLTEKGLHALLDSQFKIGPDAGIAFATLGTGVAGATTAALRADVVAFARARGLYIGISLDGSLIGQRSDWNQTYYGHPMAAQQIVLQGEGTNPGAEPLREVLGRLSSGG